jgi:hypothetical protein
MNSLQCFEEFFSLISVRCVVNEQVLEEELARGQARTCEERESPSKSAFGVACWFTLQSNALQLK